MTKLEENVLDILKKNARISTHDLAKLTQSSEKEIEKAIKKLEKSGIILQYTTVVNEEKLKTITPAIRALIEVKIRPEKKTGFKAIARRISGYSNVVDHYLVSGDYDFMIIVEGQTLEEISSFVTDKLATIDHVTSTITHFIMKKYKEKGVQIDDLHLQNRLAVTP